MDDIDNREISELEGKTVLITKAEKDNIELEIDGVKYTLYPFCRSCEYNDEVFGLTRAGK